MIADFRASSPSRFEQVCGWSWMQGVSFDHNAVHKSLATLSSIWVNISAVNPRHCAEEQKLVIVTRETSSPFANLSVDGWDKPKKGCETYTRFDWKIDRLSSCFVHCLSGNIFKQHFLPIVEKVSNTSKSQKGGCPLSYCSRTGR